MSQGPAGLYSRLDQTTEPNVTPVSPPQGQVTLPPQAPVTTGTPRTKPREKYKTVLYKLGIIEIVFGVLSFVLCIASLIIASTNTTYEYFSDYNNRTYNYRIRYSVTYASQGIWCGAVILASGILGFKARHKPSLCLYNANMSVSIVASVFMATLCIMSGICAGDMYPKNKTRGMTAVHSLLAIVGFAGMVICIIHSAYCCAGICCRKKQYQGVVVYAAHPAYPQQQMVQLPNGQCIMVPTGATQGYAAGPSSFYPPGQMPPSVPVVAPGYPAMAGQPMSKEQEAQMNPPEYTAHPSDNPAV